MQADVPAQAPVAAKTKEEAIARSKNVSSQQPQAAGASPQTDRTPAPQRKEPKPFDPKEAERRREGGEDS